MANVTPSANLPASRGGSPHFPGREVLRGGIRL